MALMVSISGLRGIIGESLTPDVVVRYASAFGEYCRRTSPRNPTIVIGRDGRITGKTIAHLVSSTLIAEGINVRAIGICPTPTVQIAVERSGAAGGIAITASHNPIEWNGLKFIAPTGMFLDAAENQRFWGLVEAPHTYARWNELGNHTPDDTWIRTHIDSVLALPVIDRAAIARRKLRVVADCVNASGGVIVPTLLRELGCTVIETNCDVSGIFNHTPEPIPENLTGLAARVKSEHADLGIAVDPDTDRLVFITDLGEAYGEEYTVASAIQFILGKLPSAQSANVVVNLSTTRAVDDIARRFGASLVRTAVGEINVAKRMKEIGAVIGGEGSGGVIYPAVHLGRDAIVGIGLILQMLTDSGGTMSELKASLPQYAIAKGKSLLGKKSPDEILASLSSDLARNGTITTEDGLKVDFPDSWVHLRKSNTEPIIRVIAEARTVREAVSLVEQIRRSIDAMST